MKKIENPDIVLDRKADDADGGWRSMAKTFETFVVKPTIHLAHHAAMQICQAPDSNHLLYFYGASGVGKTHLLMAIADRFRKDGKSVRYLSCQQFYDEMIDAIRNGTNAEFRMKYHEADLVLLDDLQSIDGKETTQSELFSILAKRLREHKQTVCAGSVLPPRIALWNCELASCLNSGLCIEMQAPNHEETAEIVANKLKEHGMIWPEEACRYVAMNIARGHNQIDGEINKIVFLNGLDKKVIA